MFHGRVFLNSVLLLMLVNFVSGSFQSFSAACAAATIHGNHFFRLYQQSKSSESKVSLGRLVINGKRFLKTAKIAYANKTKESITSQKLGSWDFWC